MAPNQQPGAAPQPEQARKVSPEDKALAGSLTKAIESALKDREEDHKLFAENRRRLRGIDTKTGEKLRSNLHFANLAAMRPQVYAKDPEYTVQPSRGVPPGQLPAMRAFGETAEAVLERLLVQDARLKRRAKRILTSAYTNALGWWKLSWQEGRPADPLIANRIKDTQDNLQRLEHEQQAEANEPGCDPDLKAAELRETLAGLQTQAEVRVGRGLVLDFVLPEDLLILDKTISEIQDYERSGRIGHGVWLTREQFEQEFGYEPEKARVYRSKSEQPQTATSNNTANADKSGDLLRVYEVWDQDTNRVHTVCIGDEGLCRPSYTPDWTGKRWYPFFLLCWNEIDGAFIPPSDVELTDEVVREYNRTRADFEKDREDARPFTVYRKGGSLTPADVANIRNRRGNDMIGVEGNGGNSPLSNDIQSITLGTINPANYDTTAARQDMEMLVGGGDAARGAVLKAKTATEAEIVSQGLRGRSAERTDEIEDLLSAVGTAALEMCLRKLSPQEVAKIAGADAQWPQLTVDEILSSVSVRVRGGSTGKPDRLQEQDRWTKLLPVIKDTVKEIVATRQAGQEQLAQLAMALLKETLRRFDERFEVERYLPETQEGQEVPGSDGQPEITPEMVQQAQEMIQALQQKVQELEQALQDKEADRQAQIQRDQINAARDVEVAKVRAPIEAQATAEVARIKAEAETVVKVRVAELDAEAGAQERETAAAENQAVAQVAASVAELSQELEQQAAALAELGQIVTAPKPRVRVVHRYDEEGRLLESVPEPINDMEP